MRKKPHQKTEDGFLTRWSEKKLQAEKHQLSPEQIETDEDAVSETQLPQQADDQAEPVLTDEDMPDINDLDQDSDYSGFLSTGVSDELRRLALRKLFRSEKFGIRDGLDDYDDDFRSFAALGDLITSDIKHQMELAEQKQKLAEQQSDEAIQDADDTLAHGEDRQIQDTESDACESRPDSESTAQGESDESNDESETG